MPATPLFRRIDVAPAYQKVADAIEREIINGRIKPGEPIGTEQQLVAQFGVNRSTVREGIRVLEEGGLIRRDSSRRLQACLPRYNKLATRLSRALILHEVTFRELFEASMTLEVASVEGAVERATEENIAELAGKLKLDAAALEKTITEFNAAVQPGTFDHTILDDCRTEGITPAKTHWARKIETPPYLAYPVRPGITFTYLGTRVNKQARMLMQDGKPSANMFAAGEIMAGNVLGKGYAAGIGMTIGSVFGRVAGREAAKNARN